VSKERLISVKRDLISVKRDLISVKREELVVDLARAHEHAVDVGGGLNGVWLSLVDDRSKAVTRHKLLEVGYHLGVCVWGGGGVAEKRLGRVRDLLSCQKRPSIVSKET
jgi:hypothetical protein